MSQQNFPQKTPTMQVNESQAIPAAVVHAQTREGKDEAIVGAGLMLRDGGPGTDFTEVSESNPVPVKATLTGTTVDMATETTLAQSVDRLNSILSRLEGKLDTAIFDSQGNPISTNNRLPVDVGGQIEADVNLGDVTVDLGVVKQGGKDASAEPWEVQLTGSLGAGLRRAALTGTIDPSQTKVVLDIPAGQAVEILSMEVTSLNDNLRVRVRPRRQDGELSAIPLIVLGGGGYVETPTLSGIRQHGMALWEFSIDQPGSYKIRSTCPLPMPNGGDIALINETASPISGGAVVVLREL